MTTATIHTQAAFRALTSEQVEAVSGGLGTVFKSPLVLQVIPADPMKRRTEVTDSRDRYANLETPVASR